MRFFFGLPMVGGSWVLKLKAVQRQLTLLWLKVPADKCVRMAAYILLYTAYSSFPWSLGPHPPPRRRRGASTYFLERSSAGVSSS